MHPIRRQPRFRQCPQGAAIIEFALVLPIVLMLLAGTVEMSRLALIHMKLDKAANAMSDFVTQGSVAHTAELGIFAHTMPQIMSPFAFNGTVIFSSVSTFQKNTPPCNPRTVNCIAWQHRPVGSDGSRLGTPGSSAALPGNYTLQTGQDVIIAEVFYDYAPLLGVSSALLSSLAPQKLYKAAMSKPRQGTLTTLKQ